MKVGYARVSTKDQTLDIQLSRLADAGCALFFEEKISGAAKKRPQIEAMLAQLRKGDVVVVTKLDRLARSTAELLRVAEALNEKSAGLQSLDEPWADTTTPAGKMIMTVFANSAITTLAVDCVRRIGPQTMTASNSAKPQDNFRLVHNLDATLRDKALESDSKFLTGFSCNVTG